MGPRPPRPGAAALAGAARPPSAAIAPPRTTAPVGAPSPRHRQAVETEPLPADTRRALSGIVRQLRDVPRAIIGDPAEVVHFLGRTARALERLRDTPVPVAAPPAQVQRPPQLVAPVPSVASRILTPRERAEAVFGKGVEKTETLGRTSTPHFIQDRRGRGVCVEVRRARAAGQLEMPV